MAISYPTSLDSFTDKQDGVDYPQAIDINDVQDAIEALETKLGVDNSGDTSSIDYKVNNFFVSGRKLWLYEDTAPTGWTTVSVTDAVLAVKGGTQAYNVSGGNTAGTWTQPDHTLTIDEIPSHNHGGSTSTNGSHQHYVQKIPGSGTVSTVRQTQNVNADDLYTDSAGNHSHTISSQGGGQPHNHGGDTWRPYATVGIIVEKS